MRKCDQYLECGVRYRYAPETFWATLHGKPIRFCNDEWDRLTTAYIKGSVTEALVTLKRVMRERERTEAQFVTVGFMYADGSRHYIYTSDLPARADDIEDRLRVYKLWKNYVLEHECRFPRVTTAELDGVRKVIKKEENVNHIDIAHPVTVPLWRSYVRGYSSPYGGMMRR